MHLHRVGAVSVPVSFSWRPRDCSLYALAVGGAVEDVAFTTEGNAGTPQLVYPTFAFAVVAAIADSWPDPCFDTGDFPLEHAVLGEQSLTIHTPLAPEGDVAVEVRVAGIHDKGSGALVVLEQVATAAGSDAPAFTSTVGLFIRGEGGFGGDPAPRSAAPEIPDRAPDDTVAMQTLAIQTALYRHAGNDTNPIHVDPAFARGAGFEGPILTGQNTLGVAGRALVHTVCDGDPARLHVLGGRFVAPAYNGDELITEVWRVDATTASFRVTSSRDTTLVDRGLARLR